MKTAIQQENLPTDWSTVELGGLLERITNGLTCEQEKEPPGIPVTRIETISNGVVDFERVRYVRDLDEAKKARFILQRGDILFSHINSDLHLGKTAVVMTDKPLLHGMNLLLLRTKKDQLDPYYLHYLFNYYRRSGAFMAIAQHAVNQSSLNQKKINSLNVPLAPLDQQKRIVAEIEKQFSRLDEAVANLKRVKANLQRYKAAVLKAAVEGRLVETEAELARREGRSYETGAQLLQRILETRRSQWKGKGKYSELAAPDTTALPELPEGWLWVTWEMILAPEDGAFRRGPFGSTLKKSIFVESGHKVYEQYNAINDDPSFGRYYITDDKYKSMDAFAVRAGDFLVSCSGTIGRITQIPDRFESGVINQALLRVRTNNEVISDSYFLMLFRSPYFQQQILDNAQGAAMANVKGVADLKAIPIPLPPVPDQARIVLDVERRLSLLRQTEAQVDANLHRASRLRQSILSQAFSSQ